MKKIFLILVILLLSVSIAGAACTNGSMATETVVVDRQMTVYKLDITSDASSGDLDGTSECQIRLAGGYIHKVEVAPDSGGTAPDDLYDCRINSALGVDIMQGELQNLPQTNTVSTGIYTPLIGGSAGASEGYGHADIDCENMGNSNGTTFHVYIWGN